MPLAMTAEQRQELNIIGFTVLPSVLQGRELNEVRSAMEEVVAMTRSEHGVIANETVTHRNALARHPAMLNLIDHPTVLPLVVDTMGVNLQNRDSIFVYTPAYAAPALASAAADDDDLQTGWHYDFSDMFAGATVDGTLPLLDLKATWYISDHSHPEHSTTLLVKGSYKWTERQRATWQEWLDPSEIFTVRVPAGSVLLWRSTSLHAVTQNKSGEARMALHVSYGPRWIRQTFGVRAESSNRHSSNVGFDHVEQLGSERGGCLAGNPTTAATGGRERWTPGCGAGRGCWICVGWWGGSCIPLVVSNRPPSSCSSQTLGGAAVEAWERK
jgi:ectoine hydroxylase-related dioxygenase (phytanoyl-CoA dioxygenase family)